MCFPATYAVPPTAAARNNGRRRNIVNLLSPELHVIRQAEAEGDHQLGRGRDQLRPADLRRDGDQYADQVLRGGPGLQRVGHLPEVGGRRGVECYEGGHLDQGKAARVKAALGLPVGSYVQACREDIGIPMRQGVQHLPGVRGDIRLDGHGHGRGPFVNRRGWDCRAASLNQPWRLLARPASPAADGERAATRQADAAGADGVDGSDGSDGSDGAGGLPISSIIPRSSSRMTTSRITTSPVEWPQKTKIRAMSATAPMRRPLRCWY